MTSQKAGAVPSDARCEVCGRPRVGKKRCYRVAHEEGFADMPNETAKCYRLGYERLKAARVAAPEAQAVREALGLMRAVDAALAIGFIRCGTCGDQEDTADMDVRHDVRKAIDILQSLPPAPASRTEAGLREALVRVDALIGQYHQTALELLDCRAPPAWYVKPADVVEACRVVRAALASGEPPAPQRLPIRDVAFEDGDLAKTPSFFSTAAPAPKPPPEEQPSVAPADTSKGLALGTCVGLSEPHPRSGICFGTWKPLTVAPAEPAAPQPTPAQAQEDE